MGVNHTLGRQAAGGGNDPGRSLLQEFIIHPVARGRVPAFDPAAAECAVAVPVETGLAGGAGVSTVAIRVQWCRIRVESLRAPCPMALTLPR